MKTSLRACIVGSALACVAFTASAPAQAPTFSVPQAVVPNTGNSIAEADFNLDGHPDVAVGYAGDGVFGVTPWVSVLLGTGTGLFGPPLDLTGGNMTVVSGVATGDVNGDGKPDLLVTRFSFLPTTNLLSGWLGNGAGGFGPRFDIAVSSSPNTLALADLDNDGRLDVVTGHQGTSSVLNVVAVHLGNGNGTFVAPVYYDSQASSRSVQVADLDGDGLRDVGSLATNAFGTFSFSTVDIRKGIGAGLLGPRTTINTGGNNRSLVFSDLDADGDVDGSTVISETTGGELRILRNDGSGNFTVELHVYQGTGYGQAAADFNGDGIGDLAVADGSFSSVDVFLGPITAGFGNPTQYRIGTGTRSIVVADLNGDGAKDIAAAITNSVASLLGTPGGGFLVDDVYSTSPIAKKVAFGDLDADGIPDAVVSYFGVSFPSLINGGLNVFRGLPGGLFAAKTDFPSPAIAVTGLALGDCDSDGLLDAVATNANASHLQLYKGNGAGALALGATVATGATPIDVALADLNGDGILDAVTADSGAASLSVMMGNGAGSFVPTAPVPAGLAVSSVAIGDMNNDGLRDLVCANPSSITMSVILAAGGGAFLPKVDYATPGGPSMVAIGDTNYDGRLDVAVACSSTSVVHHRLNVGSGVLAPATDYPMAGNATSVHYLDWNGDGWHDLASITSAGTVVSVRFGDGSGTFGARYDFAGNTFGTGSPFSANSGICAVADWNADGRSDLAIVSGNVLATLANRQPAAPSTSLYGTGTGGCVGQLGASASGPAKLGTAIRLMTTNAPDRTLGLGVLSTIQDVPGTDSFGIGVLCHVNFNTPSLMGFDAPTDNAGVSFVDFAIPNNPALAGMPVYYQTYFLGTACRYTPFYLSSSRGLVLTLLP